MNTRQNKLILFALLLLTQTFISAQTHSTKIELPEDSISVAAVNDSVPAKRSFFKKFLDYFNDANKEKKNKKFDFSVIGGPHYSSDTKFGLGLVAACIVPILLTRFFLPQMFLFMEMCRLSASICWEFVEIICFRRINIG